MIPLQISPSLYSLEHVAWRVSGEVSKKKLYFIFSFTFLAFFVAVFHHNICVFMIFIYFFDEVLQQNINQSET